MARNFGEIVQRGQLLLWLCAGFSIPWIGTRTLAGLEVMKVILAAVVGLEILLVVTRGRYRWRFGVPDLVVIAVGVWATSSLLWTIHDEATLRWAYRYFFLAILFVSLRSGIRRFHDWRIVGFSYVLGAGYAAYLVLSSVVGGWDLASDASIAGMNQNNAAYNMAIGLPVFWGVYKLSGEALGRWLSVGLIAYTGLIVAGVFVTGSRGALFGIGVWLILAAYDTARSTTAPKRYLTTTVWAGVALAFWSVLPLEVTQHLLDAFGITSGQINMTRREVLWPRAAEYIEMNPFLGIGAGAFAAREGAGTHNVVLGYFSQLGVVGVILLSAFLVSIVAQTYGDSKTKAVVIVFVANWLVLTLVGEWDRAWGAWFCIAWISITRHFCRQVRPTRDVPPSCALISPDRSTGIRPDRPTYHPADRAYRSC